MARGQRKSIEEKILQKQEIIDNLSIRIDSEQKELEALLIEQKNQEAETLYDFIKASNLGVYDAIDILKQHIDNSMEVPA